MPPSLSVCPALPRTRRSLRHAHAGTWSERHAGPPAAPHSVPGSVPGRGQRPIPLAVARWLRCVREVLGGGGPEPGAPRPAAGTGLGCSAVSPRHVHCGDVELDPFEPQDHEKALAEGAVSDVFSIQASLPGKQRNTDLTHRLGCLEMEGHWSRSWEEGTWGARPGIAWGAWL